jgi:hypothetical protein
MRMDKWLPERGLRRRGLAAAILGGGLLLALAACGQSAAQVTLPKKASQLSRVVAAPPSVRQLVVSAYEGYWQATSQAINSGSEATAKSILASYVPPSSLPGLLRGMAVLWQRDEMSYGAPVFHIMSVKVTGPHTAAVHDCIDLSHTGFQNRKSGDVVGGLGQSHDYLITTMALEHGRWLVTGAIPVVQACKY